MALLFVHDDVPIVGRGVWSSSGRPLEASPAAEGMIVKQLLDYRFGD
jgi:hypothetical protein